MASVVIGIAYLAAAGLLLAGLRLLARPESARRGVLLGGGGVAFAVAAALVSALADKPLPQRSVWFGEVSLAGEIRPVAHAPLRAKESAKLGFETGFGPADSEIDSAKLNFNGLTQLANLVDRVMAR